MKRLNGSLNASPNLFLVHLTFFHPLFFPPLVLPVSLFFSTKTNMKYKLDFRCRAELLFYVRHLPAVNPCRLSIRLPLRYLNSSSILIFIRTTINFYGRPFTF